MNDKDNSEIFKEILPYKTTKIPNTNTKQGLHEILSILTDTIIKIDFTAAQWNFEGYIKDKTETLNPLFENLGIEKIDAKNSIETLFDIKKKSMILLGAIVDELTLQSESYLRLEDYGEKSKDTFDPKFLDYARDILFSRYGEAQVFLNGSFLRKDSSPNDLDFKVITPFALSKKQYEDDRIMASLYLLSKEEREIAQKNGEEKLFSITNMTLPDAIFKQFALSTQDEDFSKEGSIYFGPPIEIPIKNKEWTNEREFYTAIIKLHGVMNTLKKFEGYKHIPAVINARKRDPYYGFLGLSKVFGKNEFKIEKPTTYDPNKEDALEVIKAAQQQVRDIFEHYNKSIIHFANTGEILKQNNNNNN